MSQLEKIVKLAQMQLEQEELVAHLENELKEAKQRFQELSERELPDAMEEAEVEEFTLKDGRRVKIVTEYYASISENNRAVAFGWLRGKGHDGIIKRDVTAKFTKGQDKLANSVVEYLRANYAVPINDKESVHYQTLRAFIREQFEGGVDVPMDTFGVHIINKAKIGVK